MFSSAPKVSDSQSVCGGGRWRFCFKIAFGFRCDGDDAWLVEFVVLESQGVGVGQRVSTGREVVLLEGVVTLWEEVEKMHVEVAVICCLVRRCLVGCMFVIR